LTNRHNLPKFVRSSGLADFIGFDELALISYGGHRKLSSDYYR
jgi:hypothetical protein